MILAAGMGKRMQSQSTKLVHNVAGRPMVRHVVEAARAAGMSRTVVVVGNQADEVRRAVGETDKRIGFAYQDSQRGTGHAVLSAEGHLLGYEGDVLILNGDLPALRPDTLHRFVDFHRASGAPLSLMTAVVDVPGGYGRVIRTYNGDVSRIVEEADATVEEKAIKEINCGIYCVDTTWLWDPLKRARADNAQREIYLTDLVEILRRDGHKVAAFRHADAEEVLGVNDRRELSAATRALHRRKVLGLMKEGVTVLDPETTFVDVDVRVGQDTILEPGVMLHTCSSASTPSCIRAPPDAETSTYGKPDAAACSMPRARRSPATIDSVPPTNRKSNTASHTARPPRVHVPVRTASFRPSSRSCSRVSWYGLGTFQFNRSWDLTSP